jgi:putative ABC transport system permease protein
MRSQWREQPLRLGVTVLAIALGVALGAAVYLVNGAALNEFGLATKRLVGEADVVVRGPRDGFSEKLFVQLARESAVSVASPVLELEAALAGKRETLKILGIDPFRAATLQPALIGDIGGNILALFQADGIALSASAAQELKVRRGDTFQVIVGSSPKTLHVLDVLPESSYPEVLGLMDIASAQWTFDRIGRLNRIDLRVNPGNDVAAFRDSLKFQLPAGVLAVAPQVERDRAKTVTRAYRVNLNVLALVALWTGAFLVFSTQSLSVLRRRRSLGLLRALGLTQAQLRRALMGEGAALGLLGSLLGVILGVAMAAAILKFLTGDLGNNQLRIGASLVAAPFALIAFLAMGTAVSAIGAWVPARAAARQPPARSLKGGDEDYAATARSSGYAGVALLIIGAALARLPPVAGLPVFGYAAIAALLFGAVLLVPASTVRGLKLAPRTHHVVLDTAVSQLRENVGLSTLSLSAIIVSFSLMVAMAIMVYSFRLSFDRWLGKLLPADIQLREPFGNDTAFWSRLEQARLAAAAGVGRIEFRRTRQLLLDAAHAPVTLIARGATARDTADQLPLVKSETLPLPGNAEPVWISEALQDLYGYRVGSRIDLPLAGHSRRFTVAGVWRDYARTTGSIAMSRQAYVAASGDDSANEGSVWLAPGADAGRTEAALRGQFARGDSFEILTSIDLRERSLSIFDHAFAVTYALEAIAVLIGLTGVSFAASSTALARRAEFGMLRHIGMLRREVIGMLASEGILTSAFGVTYGLVLGAALSIVLVYVINRQSFNWSIDLAVPGWQLAILSAALVAAAAMTAIISGRAATSRDAVHAVREDW